MNPNNRDSAHRPVEVVVVTESSRTSKALKAFLLLILLVIFAPFLLTILGLGVTLGVGAVQANKAAEQGPAAQEVAPEEEPVR